MERSVHRNSHQRLPARAATVIFALVVLAQSAARGDETSGFKFEFDGFATLGVVHSSEDQADFLGSLLLERGAGYSQSWSPEVDSRVGAQVTATFNSTGFPPWFRSSSEQQADGDYTPHVEWANLKYQLTPDASVRVGRIVLPSFMVSDYRKVGYANVWVRPPVEVYGADTDHHERRRSTRAIASRREPSRNTIQATSARATSKLPAEAPRRRGTTGA